VRGAARSAAARAVALIHTLRRAILESYIPAETAAVGDAFALRETLTVVFGLSAGWYLIGLGMVAIAAILFEPDGLWPLVRGRLGGDWLSVRREPPAPLRLGAPAAAAGAATSSAQGLGATPGDS